MARRLMLVATGAAIALAAAAGPVRADQIVLVDENYTHDRTSHHVARPSAQQPADWRMPVDYAQGTAYVRVEVKTKPSDVAVNYEICFISRGGYGCLGARRFTMPGVLSYSVSLPRMWQYAAVDWSKPLGQVTLIVKDSGGALVDRADPKFYPMQIRTTIVVVSKGGMPVNVGGSLPLPPVSDAGGGAPDARRDAGTPPATPDADSGGAAPGEGTGGTGAGGGGGASGGGTPGGSSGPGVPGLAPPAMGLGGKSPGASAPASEDMTPVGPHREATTGGCSLLGPPVAGTGVFGLFLAMTLGLLARRVSRRREPSVSGVEGDPPCAPQHVDPCGGPGHFSSRRRLPWRSVVAAR